MSVSAISSNSVVYTPSVQPKAESAEVQKAGRDNDGDKDDGGAAAVKAPTPTVNLNGQKIGGTINVAA